MVKTVATDDGELKAVEYQNIIAVVINALHELNQKMLNAGSARLEEQNKQLEVLEQRINALENDSTWNPRTRKSGGQVCDLKTNPKGCDTPVVDKTPPNLTLVAIQSSNQENVSVATIGDQIFV